MIRFRLDLGRLDMGSRTMRTPRSVVLIASLAAVVGCGSSDDGHGSQSTADQPMDHAVGHDAGGPELEAASVMGRPDRIIAGPQGNEGQFIVECDLSHMASDDPILYPSEPGRSHLHAFFGNVETSASSKAADMLGADTSCDDHRDTAAYWVPVLMDGGRPIQPEYSVAYYRAGPDVDPRTVVAYPPGLVMIAGDPMASSEQPLEVVAWSCGSGARKSVEPPICPIGADVRLSVTFPDCWDGKNLDVPGHRRHMRYSTSGQCPSSHPVSVPQLLFAVHFEVNGDLSGLRLSSGTLGTGHADFINSWDQEHLEHEVDLCIRRQNVCGIASGRRPI